ncbi:hypothetical protein RND81_10G036800 [Saponaria officinalis]|uniref:Agglutinin domain-containing protein n=1 Tax=Saponaria officinalis TaxID=3572 RepID=A0AAW1I022_SAPOF
MALPTIVCLKSELNNKYLRYRAEDVQTHGLLQFSAENPMDSLSQFEVVTSTIGSGDLVHLKSRYTDKFLVRWSPNHYWITASADKPNEDQTNWACTLFKPSFILDSDTKKARLLHVQLGHYACLWQIGAPFDSCLFAGSKDIAPDSRDIVSVTNWSSILKLPNNVAFKGDNGRYLGAFVENETPYLQFSYDDPNDPKVAQEVFSNSDGTILIKSKYYGKFWRIAQGDWIVADVVQPSPNSAGAMFRVNVVDIGVVALLNMSKTWYCKRYTIADARQNVLNAATQSADEFALLQVEDLGDL